jgi:hypothetical protein
MRFDAGGSSSSNYFLIHLKEFGISGMDDTTVGAFWVCIAFSWDFFEALAWDLEAFFDSRTSYTVETNQ